MATDMDPSPTTSTSKTHMSKWLVLVMAVTFLAGLLFGYDQGVISGALPFITDEFDLSSTMQEVVTSWVTLGALFGALIAGIIADKIGRKKALILAATLFAIAAVIQALAPTTAVLVVGRFLIGIGVGVASVAAPLYAAEMSSANSRGRFVSMYQLAITVGILVAYLVDDLLATNGEWRVMLGLAILPGGLLCLFVLPALESPRWLVKVGRDEKAKSALEKTYPATNAGESVSKIKDDLAHDQPASWAEIFGRKLRKPLLIGIGLAVFQQVTGINAIIYYANEIFAQAGFTSKQSQAEATLLCVGVVNVLATFIAVAYVDRFGRKPLLLAGLVGMFVSLSLVGGAFLLFDEKHLATSQASGPSIVGIVTMMALVVYIASFAFSLGPVVWTMISEIYPNRVRGRAIAVATAFNWGSAFIVSATFLTLLDDLGTSTTFFIFAGMCVLAFVWIKKRVPETKGKTLEEVSAMLGLED